ncbi:uncharacterized protein LOC115949873 [Quercus lobata]|uniref:uncharacterized protein LOC115949873 n=1 Tax=Quercus lobata TaxID=97700 RepID=UPI0012443E36|nr:uncharacterized protein LOC115949873 [Quercus lobata]
MDGISQNDPPVSEQTQRANKRPIKEPTTKGKKVAKKVDRASEMTMALQEYIVLARERFSNKKGKSSASFEHVAQSTNGGDPCLLGRALEVLNQYEDLDDDTYVNIAKYDFDDAYFDSDNDDMDIGGCGDDMNIGGCDDDMDNGFNCDDMDISDYDDDMTIGANTNSEYDSDEEEFWFVFPIIGKMMAYFQRHYD